MTELVVEFGSSAYMTDTKLSRLKRIPKEFAKLPRVTKEDLTLVLEPMGQRLTNAESELRQQREVIGGIDKRVNQSENEISIIKLSIP